jgi:hypothetical protein
LIKKCQAQEHIIYYVLLRSAKWKETYLLNKFIFSVECKSMVGTRMYRNSAELTNAMSEVRKAWNTWESIVFNLVYSKWSTRNNSVLFLNLYISYV